MPVEDEVAEKTKNTRTTSCNFRLQHEVALAEK